MKERPILMSGPSVRSILDGRKTQTRRILKKQPPFLAYVRHFWFNMPIYGFTDQETPTDKWWKIKCPYGQPGDRLWVQENFYLTDNGDYETVVYAADIEASAAHKEIITDLLKTHRFSSQWAAPHLQLRPSIHMRRWASRILLEIVSVRVERLQDVSEQDALAEGFIKLPATGRIVMQKGGQYFGNYWHSAKDAFCALWCSINGPASWDANPWVWVIEFKQVSP